MLTGGVGLIENQIKNWVRQHVCQVDPEHGKCKKVVIRHLNIDKKPQADVHTINIASDPAFEGTEIADKIISEISDHAQQDANDMKSGVQTYGLYAYYTKSINYVPRKVFRVPAEEDFEPDGGPSEPPTEKGILQQLMRHNEINSKNSLVAMGYIMQTFQKEINEQRSMNKTFMSQQVDTMLLLQETMNDHHKRRTDEKKSEMEMTVYEGIFEHLKIILPIVANKLAGKEIFPAKMERELYVLASFLENLDPKQQTALRDMLSPQQLTMLAELLGMYEERKHKLTGEEPTEEGSGKGDDGKTTKALPPRNRMLTLFEKRRTLVESDNRLVVSKDEVTRKIEEKAEKIRDHLKNVAKSLQSEKKD